MPQGALFSFMGLQIHLGATTSLIFIRFVAAPSLWQHRLSSHYGGLMRHFQNLDLVPTRAARNFTLGCQLDSCSRHFNSPSGFMASWPIDVSYERWSYINSPLKAGRDLRKNSHADFEMLPLVVTLFESPQWQEPGWLVAFTRNNSLHIRRSTN